MTQKQAEELLIKALSFGFTYSLLSSTNIQVWSLLQRSSPNQEHNTSRSGRGGALPAAERESSWQNRKPTCWMARNQLFPSLPGYGGQPFRTSSCNQERKQNHRNRLRISICSCAAAHLRFIQILSKGLRAPCVLGC